MRSHEDHAVGLELQIIELVERKERAAVQGRRGDATALQREIDLLQAELAELAEQAVAADAGPPPVPGPVAFHDAAPVDRSTPAA